MLVSLPDSWFSSSSIKLSGSWLAKYVAIDFFLDGVPGVFGVAAIDNLWIDFCV